MITGHELHLRAKAAFENLGAKYYDEREKIEAMHNFVSGYLAAYESGAKEFGWFSEARVLK
jgi:hypothetical protein|tara:strand:+ start:1953 stop:2135 length:183 start_codon:yes stop_codon:yes gene_type:complete